MHDNRTAYVILGILSIEPNKSGYDIRKAVEGSVGYFWGESYGQIYPTLKRLAAEGLIVPSGLPSATRKRRQEYSLTDAGRACLRDWLAVPFQNDPPRNEFLLKLFFGRAAAPSVSIAHVRDCREKNRIMLATLTGLEDVRSQAIIAKPLSAVLDAYAQPGHCADPHCTQMVRYRLGHAFCNEGRRGFQRTGC